MKSKYFLDTDIFIHSFNKQNQKKKSIAEALIKETLKSNKGIISFQVVQEFIEEATEEFKSPIQSSDCKLFISNFLSPICEVYPTMDLYRMALDIKNETGYDYKRSLKIASVIGGEAKTLYTSKFPNTHEIKGIRIIDPFLEGKIDE